MAAQSMNYVERYLIDEGHTAERTHPDEEEDLELFPPRLYWPHGEGMRLKIGKSTFVIRNNKVEKELRESEAPLCYWL